MSVPLYSSDLALLDVISDKRALRLEDCGLAKVVRHKGTSTEWSSIAGQTIPFRPQRGTTLARHTRSSNRSQTGITVGSSDHCKVGTPIRRLRHRTVRSDGGHSPHLCVGPVSALSGLRVIYPEHAPGSICAPPSPDASASTLPARAPCAGCGAHFHRQVNELLHDDAAHGEV
jgi:hypothetical protein